MNSPILWTVVLIVAMVVFAIVIIGSLADAGMSECLINGHDAVQQGVMIRWPTD